MIDYLKNIVKESDDPAHIREFTKLLVSIQEMNADLVKMTIETKKELNKKYATSKRPENEEPNAKINNQQNNFFTGTTKDILEAMKSGKIKDITPDEQ